MKGFRSWGLTDLRGRAARTLTDILVRHLEAAIAATEIIQAFEAGTLEGEWARDQMTKIEHRGDALRSQLVSELTGALVIPLDREDLNRLSRSIDDVLDNLRDFLRERTIYGAGNTGAARFFPNLLALIAETLRHLTDAVRAIRDSPSAVILRTLPAKKACNSIRREYESSLAQLFAGPLTMDVLKFRELLRRLDVVGLRLDEAIDALSDAAVKRGA